MQPAEILPITEGKVIIPPNAPKDAKLLEIRAKCVYEDDKLLSHMKQAMERNIPHFSPSPQNDHEIILVGSGPSVSGQLDTIRKLKEGRYLVAIKAAHDYLLEHDIKPDLALMVDPQPHIVKCFQKKRNDILYFIASQCNPLVFDYFKDYPVVLWHLLTGKEGEKEAIKGEMALGGGSTSGMRALTLGWAMGFRKFHLFGYDSCLSEDKLKLGEPDFTGERIKLWINERNFYANPPMAAQVTEFEKVLNAFRGQVQLKVYGDGAIPHIAEGRRLKGAPDISAVDGEFHPFACHPDYWKV